MRDDGRDIHPDKWGAGLWFKGKSLNIKTVRRANTPADVLPVCLAHNLRQGNEAHRHRSRIDPSKTGLNEVMRGPACAVVAASLASNTFDGLGVQPARRDTIMGIELVFQPPQGANLSTFWPVCLAWVDQRYQHVLSAIVHCDQKRLHMHVLALAVVDGRLDGNAMTAGSNRFVMQRRAFMAYMRATLGLRPDRKVKTLADLVVSTGKGPKTQAAAARRDANLTRTTGPEWKHAGVGMGVGGHSGSLPEQVDPQAYAGTSTPLLRSVSPAARFTASWAAVAGFQRQPSAPMALCPKPPKARLAPILAPASAHAEQSVSDDETDILRERDADQLPSQWCEELGEFIASPNTSPRHARAAAESWVASELARLQGNGVRGH